MYFNDTNSSSHEDYDESETCYSSIFRIVVNIHSSFLIIFGFFANLCSFAVLIRRRLRRRPTFSYLAFLSLSNALLSLIYAGFAILGVNFNKFVDDLPLFLFCRLLSRFCVDFLTHFSLYTLTAVDLDRIRTVMLRITTNPVYGRTNPERSRTFPRAFINVCLVEVFLGFVLFVINFHWLIAFGYTEKSVHGDLEETKCTIRQKDNKTSLGPYSAAYEQYLTSLLPIIELVLFNLLPFFISTIATIVILRHVSIKYKLVSQINKRFKKSRRRMELHLSILLISLNCVFIIFNTPHNIFAVYISQIRPHLETRAENRNDLCFFSAFQKGFDLLQQCYFMSTFFLYILTNRRFREEFYGLLKKKFCFSCWTNKTTQTSSSGSSHYRRHHHRHHHLKNKQGEDRASFGSPHLVAPTQIDLETRFSTTENNEASVYENEEDGGQFSSKCLDTSDIRTSVNPT